MPTASSRLRRSLRRRPGRAARGRQRGAVLLLAGLAVCGLLLMGGSVLGLGIVVTSATRAQTLADAAAHAAVVAAAPHADDLSVDLQAAPGSCADSDDPGGARAASLAAGCLAAFVGARRIVALRAEGDAVLLTLILGADVRPMGDGRGRGPVTAHAVVALRRPLPGCGRAAAPAHAAAPGTCWSVAEAAAELAL